MAKNLKVSQQKKRIVLIALMILIQLCLCKKSKPFRNTRHRTTTKWPSYPVPKTKNVCMGLQNSLLARQKSCFLRPDTGPCRADVIQWYFDVRQNRCYRFFWGGCQGNGNRFDSKEECMNYCYLNATNPTISRIPYFCSLAFDYGNCFGHYNRYTWDTFTKSCRRRIYSGCGGNQNNFETHQECLETCLKAPNNTFQRFGQYTTCIPLHISELY